MRKQNQPEQSKVPASYDYAVHSDFLIHWTGKDIDQEYNPTWDDDYHSSRTGKNEIQAYLARLKNIVTYGLWMTEESESIFKVGASRISIPGTPQSCFTELKVSESRRHARNYGRLGLGVKRPFLFRRFGRPVAYFGFGEQNHSDKFLEACAAGLQDKMLLNFFKPMNSEISKLNYDLYSESEWELFFFPDLLKSKKIIDPRDSGNTKEHAFFNTLTREQQDKLKFLVPLDNWFSMIIYPSAQIKNAVRWDSTNGIDAEIKRIKTTVDHPYQVEGPN